MGDWFLHLNIEGQLATWLVASCLLYMLGAQLAWQYRHPGRVDRLGRWIDHWRDQPFVAGLGESVRLLYYLGIPLAAAMIGLLRADVFGISGTDQVNGASVQGFLWKDWTRGAGLATAAVLGMAAAWLIGGAASRRAGLDAMNQGGTYSLWRRGLEVLYWQVHWAFYRSGPIFWLDDPYWGVFIGLGIALFEIGLDPAFWWALKSAETAGPALFRVGVAWISALVFLETHNLWLTAAAHAALVALLRPRQVHDVWQD
jgi:hypothetical protein